MDPAPQLSPRDSGSSGGLTTPAIIGISCSAAAVGLFILSTVLFIMYWRRQHRYDMEDLHRRQRARWTQDWDQWEGPREAQWGENDLSTGPQYTLDHKAAIYRADSQATTTTLRGEVSHGINVPPPRDIRELGSSMPTHPAYIPKSTVRGAAAIRAAPERVQLQPLPPLHQVRPQIDDTAAQTYADTAERDSPPQLRLQELAPRASSSAGVSPAALTSASGSAPSSTIGTSRPSRAGSEPPLSTTSGRPRRASASTPTSPTSLQEVARQAQRRRDRSRPYSRSSSRERSPSNLGQFRPQPQQGRAVYSQKPPASRSDQPLSGRETITISGPLAFAEQSKFSEDRRTFRERTESSNQKHRSLRLRGHPNEPQQVVEQTVVWGAPAREVTIESDDSDLYG